MIEVYLRTYDAYGDWTDYAAYVGTDRSEAQRVYLELERDWSDGGTPIWREAVEGEVIGNGSVLDGKRRRKRQR